MRECRKLDRANKRLREEVRELRQHMAENTLPRAEVEEYKKEVDEKVLVTMVANVVISPHRHPHTLHPPSPPTHPPPPHTGKA